jgi:succinate dehydrogenase / fumarate reductase cytochrome b subunit
LRSGQVTRREQPLMSKPRPRYLDLLRIRMPVPAFVSILHRVSGTILFLLIPVLLYLWQMSLQAPETFADFKAFMSRPLVKLATMGLVWAYLHHFCAGIRHLALDLHYGTTLETARATSWVVIGVSLFLTIAFGALIW